MTPARPRPAGFRRDRRAPPPSRRARAVRSRPRVPACTWTRLRSPPASRERLDFRAGLGNVAGRLVPRDELGEHRGDLLAGVDGQRAAPAEPAAGGGVDDL